MGCATGMVKTVMFLFNFLFVAGGVLMITVGALSLASFHQEDYDNIVKLDLNKTPPILLIVVGCIVFFIAFMGCCGVMQANNCMMMTYAVLLIIILMAQIGIAVATRLYQDDFKDVIRKGMKESLAKYRERQDIRESWDSMQSNLKCCGYDSYKDWGFAGIPESCCVKPGVECTVGALVNPLIANDKLYKVGCIEKMFEQFKLRYVIIAAAAIAGVELLCILFACCLSARYRRKSYM